ncbi:hypothetical protein PTSG_03370 [Salpingoeca rosetta]|uniref:EF-hand domain-containing protein n=1 Tax=Salpingoeca rosetta (strain ATCC 50818 / BSB-021) TaxID=946362 RepID=F2U503_SALR5|nr:uncharacterized protein PTSG_03370 [Salpingoeca rosetta]EGD82719.1 hypothetical protein PTSG_03370 [Salpingoeca rosetta]|eukprot:XP_004995955.1 hypothetical protein PTSG_03370 [Salpingoeca rosetta]
MGLFGSSKKEEEKQQVYFSAVDGLKKLYKSKIKPIEDTYKFQTVHSSSLTDADFDAKPQVLNAALEEMDAVLSRDIPKLMNQFPAEREDEAYARAMQGGEQGASSGNPFSSLETTNNDAVDWTITVKEQSNFRSHFNSCNPVNGKITGEAAKSVLMKSKLDFGTLGKIWNLSDIDGDGYLDLDEFCVAMHLCHKAMAGESVPDALPRLLVPPSKRSAAPPVPTDPFASTA